MTADPEESQATPVSGGLPEDPADATTDNIADNSACATTPTSVDESIPPSTSNNVQPTSTSAPRPACSYGTDVRDELNHSGK